MADSKAVKPKIIAVVGATGAGKTEFALKLSSRFKAEIICADSIQIYKNLNIGSAKPSSKQLKIVKHHLVDLLTLDEPYSSAIFSRLAKKSIKTILQKNKLPVICGSAMLYIKNLVYGIATIPHIPEDVRLLVNQTWQAKGASYCLNWLKELTASDDFKFTDPQRVKRALEVAIHTGKSIVSYQNAHRFNDKHFNCLFMEVSLPRKKLYEAIEKRTDKMIKKGLVKEVEVLIKKGVSPNIKPMQAIGYKQAAAYVLGEITYNQMVAQIKTKTKNYAKRQLSWYRKQPDIKKFAKWDKEATKEVSDFLKR